MENYDFFKNLDEKEKKHLLDNSKYVEIPKDFTLFYQGDVCNDILLLKSGVVQLLVYGQINEMIPLYEIKEGEQCIINTSSTISQTPAIATAQTRSDICGWLVPSHIIKELIVKCPSYQQYIFSLFALKFSTLTTLIEDIKFKRLDSRILDFLKQKNETLIEITHEDIASNLGTSRVVVSRVLKELEHKNLIKLHRGKIELL